MARVVAEEGATLATIAADLAHLAEQAGGCEEETPGGDQAGTLMCRQAIPTHNERSLSSVSARPGHQATRERGTKGSRLRMLDAKELAVIKATRAEPAIGVADGAARLKVTLYQHLPGGQWIACRGVEHIDTALLSFYLSH
jgi:hypothetical protein